MRIFLVLLLAVAALACDKKITEVRTPAGCASAHVEHPRVR